MSIIEGIIIVIRAIFLQKTTGFIPDAFDSRDAHYDLIFGAADPSTFKPSIDWRSRIRLREQRAWPFCVSFAAAHAVNFATGKDISVRWLATKSNTSWRGTSIRTVLEILRNEGAVLEEELPFDKDKPLSRWNDVLTISPLTLQQIGNANQRKIAGYARLDIKDVNTVKAALQSGPLQIAIGIARNYSWGGIVENPSAISLYHSVLITGYDERGNWRIGDSLVPQEKILSGRYSIPWVYSITVLPDNWKEIQRESLFSSFDRLLKERFGKPRQLTLEEAIAKELTVPWIRDLEKRYRGIGGVFGKYWIVYVAAPVYGGWSVKDVVDDAVNVWKTGNHLYDFNDEKDV